MLQLMCDRGSDGIADEAMERRKWPDMINSQACPPFP
jgi:hypothetical protein